MNNKTIIVNDANSDLPSFVTNLTKDFNLYDKKNLIIDISSYKNLSAKDVNVFLSFAKQLKKNKQSLVILIEDFDFNKASSQINIVPSLQEAYDIIEMEEIERDLGF
jgi:hypothetical protein